MISVIIPHLDQPAALRRCLESLGRQRGLGEAPEIIVVDNGSRVQVDFCQQFGAALLFQPLPGPGRARNLGVSRAGGDILAFIDADCLADPGWLAEIERCFRDRPDIDIIGGDVRIARADPHRLTWLEAYESVFAYRMQEYIKKQGFTGTGNLAVRARTFAAVGPFGGLEVAEDRDWGQRALALSFRTHYRPAMIVFHPARASFAELARKWQRHVAHDFEAIRSKPAWRLRWLLRAGAVLVSPLAEMPRIALSDRLDGLRARVLAFMGVALVRAYRVRLMIELAMGGSHTQMVARWNRT
ncbi:glycosyltransferase [Mesorhizobium sp. PUT5]|uniref:glycosyltransferase n=1 Tax=Mesorhizobium sp. PUT5 TaxID=3454629 RepID=UPI003FA464F5